MKVGIVHGAGVLKDGTLPVHARNRVDEGIRMYKDREIDALIMSGQNESGAMAKYATEAGVDREDVYIENKSKSTMENLYFSKKNFLEPNTWHDVELISSFWHQDRLRYIAERVLAENYSFEVIPTVDERIEEEIERDKRLERVKFLHDRIVLDLFFGKHWLGTYIKLFGPLEQRLEETVF
jgi:uncharacterized SAM-binding protein YcdF (DUF218 family)